MCYGGVTTLYCSSDSSDIGAITWSIVQDGIILSTIELEAIGIHIDNNIITEDNATATITIPGSDDTHGLIIACNAITTSFELLHNSTTFIVTDIPPVTDLDVQFNSATLIATWTAPSCLPVHYQYSVTVYSNDTMTNSINTTNTQYTMPSVSSCVNYTISVTVMDTGTEGHTSNTSNVTVESPFTDEGIGICPQYVCT